MKKAKRLALALIVAAAAIAAAIAALALAQRREVPYTGSRFVMSSTVYVNIPAADGLAPLRDGSEPFEGAARALEREVRYKGYTEEEKLARNAEGA